jgi:hypothetical protein
MSIRAYRDDSSLGMYRKTPSADTNVPLEQWLHIVGHRIQSGIVHADSSSNGMQDVSNQEDFHIAIVSNTRDDLIFAQILHNQIVDGVWLIAVQIASQAWRRGLRSYYECRGVNCLLWKLRLVHVDVGSVCDEIKIVFLR